MSVGFKSDLTSDNVNTAFVSRTSDTDTVGKVDLLNSGSTNIIDTQQVINDNISDISDNTTDIATINSSKGQANGFASLDGGAKVPIIELPDAVLGGPKFVGTWDADTNTPDVGATSPDQGDYYRVSVAGTTNLDGITDWGVGDWAIYNGTAWDKIDNSETVSSVNGATGVVVLELDDVDDVDVATPVDGEVLTWVNANSAWESQPSVGGLPNIVSKNANYIATTDDDIVLVDASSGAVTITLYASSGNTGRELVIKKIDSTFNEVIIDGNAAETIDGDLTTTLNTQYELVSLTFDGTNVQLMDRNYVSEMATFTPSTTAGFGTLASTDIKGQRVGNTFVMQVEATSGTVTGSEARIGLPTGLAVLTGQNKKMVGTYERDLANATILKYTVLATGSDTYVNIGRKLSTANPYDPVIGTACSATSEIFTFYATVQIEGWKG